ncbi:MAG: alkyl hydroperoxide reductase subunit F [Muribaculaceae bacterium]|nr:alkyl hydroperoxide reductase subunit F [Muribaculaceae bacterium]
MAKLDKDILDQLKSIFSNLNTAILLLVQGSPEDAGRKEMEEFVTDFASSSPSFSVKVEDFPTEESAPVLSIWKDGIPTGVQFVGIPGGHEFSSLILAVLNAAGQGKNLPDESMQKRITSITGPVEILSFVSLTCSICPDVVQALNVIALLNPAISNKVIDGGVAPQMVKDYNINGVPTIYANGDLLNVGQATLGELVGKLEEKFGSSNDNGIADNVPLGFDVVVAGGGPAGVASAIYLARKGMKVAVVAGRIGGQVKDTSEIENLISVPVTTGDALAADLRKHLDAYEIGIFDNRRIVSADLKGELKKLVADSGETFEAPQVVIATGAAWRKLNIPGEADYLGKGVAFCTHCDGPFYRGKRVAVVGGGNSGIEAAIDLAGICTHVDVFEFMDTLKADEVLQKKLKEFKNVDIHLSTALTEVKGDGRNVNGVVAKDRTTGETKEYPVSGVFVQIGLTPNSQVFEGEVAMNSHKEIEIDGKCHTSVKGVYAAGDVTDVPYKQIVIAMGEGAKAALTAVEDRMRKV